MAARWTLSVLSDRLVDMTVTGPVRRRTRRSVAVSGVVVALAAGVLVTTAVATPAQAASVTFGDEGGTRAGDVTSVTVRWSQGLTVTADHARRLRQDDIYTAFVDTRSSRPGPEFKVYAQPNSDVLGVRRVASWDDRGTAVRCRGLRVSADTFDADAPVRFFVPGGCLGDPDGAVRVTVRFERGSGPGVGTDWAPRTRKLGPTVARG